MSKLIAKKGYNKNFLATLIISTFTIPIVMCNLNKTYHESCFLFMMKKNLFLQLKNNLIATQFHPEISSRQGFEFYKSFMDLK